MSNKKLLAENTVRRFMKLANVESLSDKFVNENYMEEEMDDPNLVVAEDDEYADEGEDMEEDEYATPAYMQGAGAEEVFVAENFAYDAETAWLFEQDEPEEEMDEPEEEMDEPEMDEPEMDEPEMDEPMGEADMSLTEEEAQLLIDLGERLKSAMEGADAAPEMDAEMDLGADEEEMPEDEEEDEAEEDEIVQEVLRRVTKRIMERKLRR